MYRTKAKPYLKALEDPNAAQEERLKTLIEYAAGTTYGKRHSFSDITHYEEFVQRVPVNQYKDLWPYIKLEIDGVNNTLYPEPIEALIATSGSTGEPKLIPWTGSYRKVTSQFSLAYFTLANKIRPFLNGKLLAMVAPAIYKQIGKWDVGYASGYGIKGASSLMRRKLVPDVEVFNIIDWEEKFRETIRQAVETPNITACIGITSFVMALLRRAKYESYEWLKDDAQISDKARQRLKSALTDDGALDLQKLWPNLSVLFQGGVVRDLYEPVIHDLAGDIHIHEAYGGTEACYGLQTYEDMRGVAPAVGITYFEFADIAEGNLPPNVETIPLSDIKVNTPYRIIVSSPSGLWRYDPHDVVSFTSVNPLTMKCLGKSDNIINLSGEKVSEQQISAALTTVCEEQDALVSEFVVAPQIDVDGACYHIFVEFKRAPRNLQRFIEAFDNALQSVSRLYWEVRTANTLGMAAIHPVEPGTFDMYERERLKEGKGIIGQTKMPRITEFERAASILLDQEEQQAISA